MIKTRLVGLLSQSKKYIAFTVLWQWLALLTQILAVFTMAGLLEQMVCGTCTRQDVLRAGLIFILVPVLRFLCERRQARASYLASVDVKRVLREKSTKKCCGWGPPIASRCPPRRWCRYLRRVWSNWKPILENTCPSCFTACWRP